MIKKLVVTALCTTVMATMLGGCAQKNEPAQTSTDTTSQSETSNGDTAKEKEEIVKLKWYMSINPVATDTAKVIEELNKYTREKIGVEIDYTVMANPDYKEKMPTYINSGEYFDICFTSNWTTNYLQFVGREAFMDIRELLPEYAKETYEFIPEMMWDAVSVDGGIYGVPSYKETGWQGGLFVNSDIAKDYGIDLSTVKTLEDYTEVLKVVKEKSSAEGKDMIGISGLSFALTTPYESLTGTPALPGASAVSDYNNFGGTQEVFNQYASQEYMDYCKLVYAWNQAGYTSGDPVNYDTDTANRDNDFKNGNLFSYVISYAPGAAESTAATMGHGVEFIPLMDPLFETRNAMGGLLAISSGSEHPEKALEFINLLNTDVYVGTLIRHGIEGVHHSTVGDNQVDKTMGGTLLAEKNGYDYTFGWQFGTPFNQKWDISYPDNIEQLFEEYNNSVITSPHNGFTFNTSPAETAIAALTNVVAEYAPALETGSVDPEQNVPKFLEALKANGVDNLLAEIETQLSGWNTAK
ncbi:ABC transporter substrate-binding protein [Niameybacter massiliensis]|uniref:ABC transporter substrate-binding protein n=1 Tax=Holtiella tumoricola TaxID=3018743 RepID=A0AA42J2X7_9FIRM|nr:ABC transporter substrate-binding protein [Holtiella tumoricola]MDA3734072.1 ABC transporter substrate-binding protein [Holtiella tumoricola]